MDRRTSRSVLILTSGLAILGGISMAMLARQFTAQDATRTPFTANLLTLIYDKDGVRRGVRAESESFRSDGSCVRIRNSVNSEPFGLRVISDLQKHQRVVIDPTTGSVTTYRMSDSEVAKKHERAACEGEQAGELLGYRLVKKTKVDHAGTQTTVVEELLAPGLDCYPLSKKSTVTADGQLLARNETIATSVFLGEIAKSELDIPSGFTERTPSEALRLADEKAGRKCAECELRSYPKLGNN